MHKLDVIIFVPADVLEPKIKYQEQEQYQCISIFDRFE